MSPDKDAKMARAAVLRWVTQSRQDLREKIPGHGRLLPTLAWSSARPAEDVVDANDEQRRLL
jgi:hypothetical protein